MTFFSRLGAQAELWKLRNKKMGVKLKKSTVGRIERFRKQKKEKKALLILIGASVIWIGKDRGYELCGSGDGRLNE